MQPVDRSWPDEDEVRAFWDALVGGESVDDLSIDPDTLATIQQFHALDNAPTLDPAKRSSLWQSISTEAANVTAPATNGHHSLSAASDVVWQAPPTIRMQQRVWQRTGIIYRALAVATMAGFIGGAVGGGLAVRLAMRISAMLSDPAVNEIATENGEFVGTISAGGTLGLMMMAGLFGMGGGMLYMIVRPILPWDGWRRGFAFGVGFLLTGGFLVMDSSNTDYRTFGSPAINILTFSCAYLLFGVVVGAVADRLDRGLPPWPPKRTRRIPTIMAHLLIIPFGFFGVMLVFAFATGLIEIALIPLLIVIALLVIVQFSGRAKNRFRLFIKSDWFPRLGYAMIGVPAIAGFVLTVQSIGTILGVG